LESRSHVLEINKKIMKIYSWRCHKILQGRNKWDEFYRIRKVNEKYLTSVVFGALTITKYRRKQLWLDSFKSFFRW